MSKLIFFIDYDKHKIPAAPGILFFVQVIMDKGHDLDFITSRDVLFERIKAKRYDSVCISILSAEEIKETLKTVIQIKKIDPHLVIILGGHGVKGLSNELIYAQGIDCIVEGEEDIILPILLDYLIRAPEGAILKRPFNKSAEMRITKKAAEESIIDEMNLLFKDGRFYLSPINSDMVAALKETTFERKIKEDDEEIVINVPLSGFIIKTADEKIIRFDLDEKELFEKNNELYKKTTGRMLPLTPIKLSGCCYPYPTQEEIALLYRAYPWEIALDKNWPSISIYSQRGCHWGLCAFCSVRTPVGRRYNISFIIKILKDAAVNGIKDVNFHDDQFIQDKGWIKGLCDEIIAAGLNKKLQLSAVIKVEEGRDKGLIRRLKEAGLKRLQIGVESFLPDKIRYFYKSARGYEEAYCRAAKDVIFNCLDSGIIPFVTIILTRPNSKEPLDELVNELAEIVDVLFRAYQDFKMLPEMGFNDFLRAYPNTPLLSEEEYEKTYIPLTPVEIAEGGRVFLDIKGMELPYAYKIKSPLLSDFISELTSLTNSRGEPPDIVCKSIEHIGDAFSTINRCVEKLDKDKNAAVINNCKRMEEKLAILKKRLDLDLNSFLERMKDEIKTILKMEGKEKQLFYLNKKKEEIVRYSDNVKPYLKASKATKKIIDWLNNINPPPT
ncbi:MAG: cobalamin B12-binding domain-containing protein [Nitrospirae bacterium]|nr:cobalamin B12-binding domain-containing protein [Nitrospirota bacterium]